jgi:hypothetical protein
MPEQVQVKASNASSLIRTSIGRIQRNFPSIPEHLRATPIISGNYVVATRSESGAIAPTYGRDGNAPTVDEWLADRPIGNNLSSQGDGKYTGVNGPATYYDVNVGTSSNSASPGSATEAELIEGRNLLELEEVLPFIDPDTVIEFDTLTTDDGITLYYNARLFDENAPPSNLMNYPTAEKLAREKGTPVARTSWRDSEGKPTQWLTYEKGAFYLYTTSARTIVRADTLDEADFRANDWQTPSGCSETVPTQADLGGESQADEPTFDILNPPCSIG